MRSSYSLDIYNPEIPENKVHTIRIKEPPQPLPSEYDFLKRCGRDWKMVVLAEAVTGFVRFTNAKEHPSGRFVTNLWSLQNDEAVTILELPRGKLAEYKHRLKIPSGVTVMVGKMTSSEVMQFYLVDTAGIAYYDSRNTNVR